MNNKYIIGHDWTNCKDRPPPENIEVETKIDDYKGIRNIQSLKLSNNLWWFPDMSMYVYYTPTHWRYIIGNCSK